MLCFVSFLLMVCWNLHMPGFEIYTFSVNVVLMVVEIYGYHMVRIEIYASHDYLGEFGVNLNIKCGVLLYNRN